MIATSSTCLAGEIDAVTECNHMQRDIILGFSVDTDPERTSVCVHMSLTILFVTLPQLCILG